MQTTDNQKNGWHLDKTFSVSHLLTTVGIMITALAWASKQDARITSLEEGRKTQAEIDRRQDESRTNDMQYIRDAVREIRSDIKQLREEKR
jgi:hypothetical protein